MRSAQYLHIPSCQHLPQALLCCCSPFQPKYGESESAGPQLWMSARKIHRA
jgi:hypothetical protein